MIKGMHSPFIGAPAFRAVCITCTQGRRDFPIFQDYVICWENIVLLAGHKRLSIANEIHSVRVELREGPFPGCLE